MMADARPVAIVTGSNTGVGYETARQLVAQGYVVICACRSIERGTEAVTRLNAAGRAGSVAVGGGAAAAGRRSQHDHGQSAAVAEGTAATTGAAVFMQVDTSDLASVRDFCERVRARFPALHALVCNAGMNTIGLTGDNKHTKDGLERCFATNYVGHYYMVRLLLPLLDATARRARASDAAPAPVRVVCLGSVMHRLMMGKVDWYAALSAEGAPDAYGYSKLAMIMLAYELQRMFGDSGMTAVAVNPGAVASDIWRTMPAIASCLMAPIKRFAFLTTEQGAATSVAAATALSIDGEPIRGGEYLVPYWIPTRLEPIATTFEIAGPFAGVHRAESTPQSHDFVLAKQLWEATEAAIASRGFPVQLSS